MTPIADATVLDVSLTEPDQIYVVTFSAQNMLCDPTKSNGPINASCATHCNAKRVISWETHCSAKGVLELLQPIGEFVLHGAVNDCLDEVCMFPATALRAKLISEVSAINIDVWNLAALVASRECFCELSLHILTVELPMQWDA